MRQLLTLVALLTLAAAPPPRRYDVFMVADVRSGRLGDDFGWSLAIGEIDEDGFADFAVGAPADSEAGKDAGAVYVFSGRKLEIMHVLRPAEAGGRFGQAIGFADVDRDGQSDLIVGAPARNEAKGALYACVKLRKDKPPPPALVQEGERPGDQLGFAVSSAPARPGNELEGVLVGAPGHDSPGRDDAGRAQVLRFKGNHLKPEVVHEWEGATLDAALGTFVDISVDQDEDGTWDLFVGEPGAGEGQHGAGALRVLDGADGSLQRTFTGLADGDRFGASAAFVVLHGKGVQDHEIAVGAPGGGYVQVFGARDGAERRRLPDHPGEPGYGALISRSMRLGDIYQYAFAVASPGGPGPRAPQEFRGLRLYSGEDLSQLAQVPMANVRALLAVAGLDAEIGDELLVSEDFPDGGVVHILRVRQVD